MLTNCGCITDWYHFAMAQREHLLTWQKINHFKHAKELVRKDLLKKNLARYQVLNSKMNAMFTLSPMTFVLPKEFLPFAEVFGKIASANVEASERGGKL
jgi:Tubulin-tyrosine ligase family